MCTVIRARGDGDVCRWVTLPGGSATSAENDRLKATANRVALKVNARGDSAEARLDAVDGRIDQAIIQGVHAGVSLGLAAMSSWTKEDYSSLPFGFAGGDPDEFEVFKIYDDHAAAIAEIVDPQSVLIRLFRG